VSPILVRPVREQLEHDRVIRLLQGRLKRRGEVIINIGDAQHTPVKIGQIQLYPDLVVLSTDKARRLLGTVEVETAESVNHLEAMAQWAHLGRAKAPFHLYIPAASIDSARRLVAENGVTVSEIWTYHTIGDQTRFTMAQRSQAAAAARPAARRPAPEPRRAVATPRRAATPAAAGGGAKRAAKRPAARKAATTARKASPRPARKSTVRKPARAQKRK
jgi:hypothetical protein